jgi:hypothetical protein
VEQAIHALDGRRHTQVVIQQPDYANLIVGGGDGRYNVCVTTADERYLTLTDPTRPADQTEELVTGGQRGEFPANTVVQIEPVLRAARTFYETGTVDSALPWIDDYAPS